MRVLVVSLLLFSIGLNGIANSDPIDSIIETVHVKCNFGHECLLTCPGAIDHHRHHHHQHNIVWKKCSSRQSSCIVQPKYADKPVLTLIRTASHRQTYRCLRQRTKQHMDLYMFNIQVFCE